MRQINLIRLSSGDGFWCESYELVDVCGQPGIRMNNVWEIDSFPNYAAQPWAHVHSTNEPPEGRPVGMHVVTDGEFKYAFPVDTVYSTWEDGNPVKCVWFCRQDIEPEREEDSLKPFWRTEEQAKALSDASLKVAEEEVAKWEEAQDDRRVRENWESLKKKRRWWQFWK